jgi:amino acid adenylation domain-containing protein
MRTQSVHEIIDLNVEKFADRTAIAGAYKQLTYVGLRDRSNNLANFLIHSGATKGSIVAILIDDAVEALTAILGVLKAGCVFVPLDPNIPERRLQAMVGQVSPKWFVAESKFIELVQRVVGEQEEQTNFICVDIADLASVNSSDSTLRLKAYANYFNPAAPDVKVDPNDMCYVYFTSGSTGTPKAIAGQLKGINHFIKWQIKTLGIEEGVRGSHLLALTFDGSLRDIFVPLCAGGTVCVPDGRETILDARKLIDWLDAQQINIVHCVPSLFRTLANESSDPSRLAALRYIVMAGEPLLPADVGRWTDVYGERVQLINLYGTSETTMAKFCYFVNASDRNRRAVPVGKPIEGAAALVLDELGRVCDPGIIGEIYIRTPYRTLGYYNQPELTREVFIQNPFNDDPNDLVHKTGDIGRILEDGNYEYLGRRDQQVKIRGVRVEMGEIENLLRGHEAVADVAVIDRVDAAGNTYLCAYVVLDAKAEVEALREFLSQHLPDYMLPSSFVVMTKLPRTITGKIDRRALPVPGQSRAGLGEDYVAPRTPVEEVLAGIWTQLLGIERIGINDHFFVIGGHSLMGTQMLSRVSSAFKVGISLRALFENPTIAGLALAVTQKQVEQEDEQEMARMMEEIKLLSEDELEGQLKEEVR